jgi:23S rRNA (cytosine1962-C5)-methyltransferase
MPRPSRPVRPARPERARGAERTRAVAAESRAAAVARIDVVGVRAALARRRGFGLPATTDVVRLVDGDGDDLAGVVVDRYGAVARIELASSRWPDDLDEVGDALAAEPGVSAVVAVLRTGAGRSEQRIVRGVVPEAHVVHEGGLRFLVRVADEDAVGAGVFVDQREGRAIVRAASRGRVIVNLFAHAGAFGVAAAAGGAARVDHVDMAKKCAPWAAANLALNGVDPRRHRFIVDDALVVLSRLAKKGGAGVVVCDPPTQAVRNDGTRFVLRDALHELARDCCAALDDGGLLILSCNDRSVPVQRVLDEAARGARLAGRTVDSVVELPLPVDVTSRDHARARPMRGAVVRLV